MSDITPIRERTYVPPAFPAFEDVAAYAPGGLTRSQAITEARDCDSRLADDYRHRDLKATRVYMRPIEGREAEEFFYGEFGSGWAEVLHRPLNAAQCACFTPMWKVEPR
jgi:hypothetical protein